MRIIIGAEEVGSVHPVLFRLGPLQVRYYGLMYVIAFVAAFFLVRAEARRKGLAITGDDLLDLFLLTVPLGLVFARAYYVVFRWEAFAARPLEVFMIWHGGLAIHGGLIGGGMALAIFARWKQVPVWALADAIVPALVLGQAIGRVGNFLNGDAFGTPTSLPWGVVFPLSSPAGRAYPGQALHPAMLYECVGNLLVFALLWGLRRRPARDGFLTAVYFLGYAVVRGLVSTVRGDSLWLGPVRAAHVASAVLFVVFGAWLVARRLWRPAGRQARG
ncbi:MAG: prolipoprotein diacylglyceryl transferase [Candidatus Bipolaricaulaceae bacterium]